MSETPREAFAALLERAGLLPPAVARPDHVLSLGQQVDSYAAECAEWLARFDAAVEGEAKGPWVVVRTERRTYDEGRIVELVELDEMGRTVTRLVRPAEGLP